MGNDAQKALNSSGDCHYDVNCPIGNGWTNQINSVAMIIAGVDFAVVLLFTIPQEM